MTDPHDPLRITDREALFELIARNRKGQARMIDAGELAAALKRRVRGQDHVIDHLAQFIRLQWGKERRSRPIASLLFLGPPACGKTETGKALTEYLFDDERNMLRFDGSELSGPEGKNRLIGTPTGYEGAALGGHLTRPMLTNPRRLVMFDEIEKAYAGIHDLFLQIMGDARLTEQGSNRVADFTQAVIVLTSNAQHDAIAALANQLSDPVELGQAVRVQLKESKTFRPEIISRLDQIYVFRKPEGNVVAEITALRISAAAKEYGVDVAWVEPQLVYELLQQADKAEDLRDLSRCVDATLGSVLLQARESGLRSVRIVLNEQGQPTCVPAGSP